MLFGLGGLGAHQAISYRRQPRQLHRVELGSNVRNRWIGGGTHRCMSWLTPHRSQRNHDLARAAHYLGLFVLVAGCGGDDDGTDGASDSAATQATMSAGPGSGGATGETGVGEGSTTNPDAPQTSDGTAASQTATSTSGVSSGSSGVDTSGGTGGDSSGTTATTMSTSSGSGDPNAVATCQIATDATACEMCVAANCAPESVACEGDADCVCFCDCVSDADPNDPDPVDDCLTDCGQMGVPGLPIDLNDCANDNCPAECG